MWTNLTINSIRVALNKSIKNKIKFDWKRFLANPWYNIVILLIKRSNVICIIIEKQKRRLKNIIRINV